MIRIPATLAVLAVAAIAVTACESDTETTPAPKRVYVDARDGYLTLWSLAARDMCACGDAGCVEEELLQMLSIPVVRRKLGKDRAGRAVETILRYSKCLKRHALSMPELAPYREHVQETIQRAQERQARIAARPARQGILPPRLYENLEGDVFVVNGTTGGTVKVWLIGDNGEKLAPKGKHAFRDGLNFLIEVRGGTTRGISGDVIELGENVRLAALVVAVWPEESLQVVVSPHTTLNERLAYALREKRED